MDFTSYLLKTRIGEIQFYKCFGWKLKEASAASGEAAPGVPPLGRREVQFLASSTSDSDKKEARTKPRKNRFITLAKMATKKLARSYADALKGGAMGSATQQEGSGANDGQDAVGPVRKDVAQTEVILYLKINNVLLCRHQYVVEDGVTPPALISSRRQACSVAQYAYGHVLLLCRIWERRAGLAVTYLRTLGVSDLT